MSPADLKSAGQVERKQPKTAGMLPDRPLSDQSSGETDPFRMGPEKRDERSGSLSLIGSVMQRWIRELNAGFTATKIASARDDLRRFRQMQ
jgi:hypothetical protein